MQLSKNLRWAIASETGTSHLKVGQKKQDWARCTHIEAPIGTVSFSIISDGAGSASFGGEGASLICYSITQKIREYFQTSLSMPNDDEIWSWIDYTRDLISQCAQKRNIPRREFSATLVGLLVINMHVVTFHIGDGGIVARKENEEWISLSWPETGEYASTTYFLIDDPFPKLKILRYKNEFNAFSLFSDGIENLALDYKNNKPHPPFFNGLLNPLDQIINSKNIKELSNALADFLNGEKINERTDDDKSLIIISTK